MAQSKLDSNDVFEAPQCLICSDELTGELKPNTDIVRQIMGITKQLNSISIAGLYRTGKSYLMCRLAGKYRGFPLGSTVQSKTKGIWVWCRPHPKHDNQVLLLLDSEGLGDVAKGDPNHDNKLFALITLLSTTLIYNMMGVLNQDVLDKLNFITEISQNIRTSENSLDDGDLDMYFPELILVLRDCTLEMNIDGEDVTPDQYFEHCLDLIPGNDPKTETRNKPRLCIRKYFKRRHCFTFERPGKMKVLKRLEELTDEDLDEDFVDDTKKFLTYAHNSCKPMSLKNGKGVNGRMFANLLNSYLTSINNGTVPCIENALRSMAIIENGKAVESAVESYKRSMLRDLNLPVEDETTLSSVHQQSVADALKVFLGAAILDDNQEFQNKANNIIWQEFEGFKRDNEEASAIVCRTLLQELHGPIQEAIKASKYAMPGGYRLYQVDFKTLQDKYQGSKVTLGVKKAEVLYQFIEEMQSESEAILKADEKVTATEKEKELETQQKEAAEKKAEVLKQQCEKHEQDMKNIEKQTKENIRQLGEKQERELIEVKNHNEKVLKERLQEQKRLIEEGHEREAKQTREEIDRLKADSQQKEDMFNDRMRQITDKAEQDKKDQTKQIETMKSDYAERLKNIEQSHQQEIEYMKESRRSPNPSSGGVFGLIGHVLDKVFHL